MMVEEFENGVLSLADYEVSEPIESSYGYHITLRLPLSLVTADTVAVSVSNIPTISDILIFLLLPAWRYIKNYHTFRRFLPKDKTAALNH